MLSLELEAALKGNAYNNFINSLQSEVTKDGYRRTLFRLETANLWITAIISYG